MPDPPGTEWLRSQTRGRQNYEAASRELKLTPQEQFAYQHHLGNLAKGGVHNPDGSTSTFYSITKEIGGRTYVLPTVWDNQIIEPDEAVKRAIAGGLEKWPSYENEDAAFKRYMDMHRYMERDLGLRHGTQDPGGERQAHPSGGVDEGDH